MSTQTDTYGPIMHYEWFINASLSQVNRLIMTLHTLYGVKRAWPNSVGGEVLLSIQLDPSYSTVGATASIEKTVAGWCHAHGVARRPKQS